MSSSLAELSKRWPHLAAIFAEHWCTPLSAYSRQLWLRPPTGDFDPLFEDALHRESVRVTGSDRAAAQLLSQRVAVTAHHVTPTNGPGFLAADWIATAGTDAPLVVLAWSGVALSNSAWSGALSFTTSPLKPGSATAHRMRRSQADRCRDAGVTEQRVSLFPARMRDTLLYRLPVPDRVQAVLDDLSPQARRLFASPVEVEDYPTWAMHSCAAIEQAVLGRPVVYLDACRLLADYTAMALEDATHPLSALIMERGDRSRMLPDLSWFVVRDRRRVVTLRPTVDGFSGRGVSIAQDDLAAGLRDGRICPGLVPGFVGLTCINPLRCLGSFNQVGYLMDLHVAWGRPLDQQPTLIAGRAPGYPLDMALAGERLPDPEAVTMAHLWQRLLR